jgi:hypothetical protein
MIAMKSLTTSAFAAIAGMIGFGLPAHADPKAVAGNSLTAGGEALLTEYTRMLDELRAEVQAAVPAVDEVRKSKFMSARAEWSGLEEPGAEAPADEQKAYAEARENTEAKVLAAARLLLTELDGFLAGDELDGKLMRIAILTHATPRGMAEFSQQGAEEEKIIDSLFADEALMKQILEAGGANGGSYGQAMRVYAAIQKASGRSREPGSIFQRLALGTALHTPWKSKKEKVGVYGIVHRTDTPHDQIERYMHYEKAFLDGELDPAFKDMTAWECRFITDDPHSNEDLAWMREMMRVYRPDHITYPDYKWRYVRIVKDDMPYCSTTHDPSLGSTAQEALALGGICGRRAFIGRLSLRAFGIPTRASTQTGHAALSHWTPDGWTICLGAWWSVAYCGPQGGLDILLETQAREFPEEFRKVLRAQWIGDVLGEEDVSIRHYGQGGGFWESLAFCKKQAVVKDAEIKALELTGGMKLGESDELIGDETGLAVEIPEDQRQIVVAGDGVITIPGVACYSPRKPSDRVVFMKSWGEGSQIHYGRLGQRPELIKYRVEVPAAGEYELTARVSTVSNKQEMVLRMNREEPVSHGLPYTKGAWMEMKPLKVKLEEGRNMISITARAPNRGISIKSFQLKPVK